MGKRKNLTEFQLKIMEVLWERGEATISEVHDALLHSRPMARQTVATMMARLEKQGVVAHKKLDVLNIYFPMVESNEIKSSMVTQLIDSLFEGDKSELVSHLLNEGDYDPEELRKVAELIKKYEKRLGKND